MVKESAGRVDAATRARELIQVENFLTPDHSCSGCSSRNQKVYFTAQGLHSLVIREDESGNVYHKKCLARDATRHEFIGTAAALVGRITLKEVAVSEDGVSEGAAAEGPDQDIQKLENQIADLRAKVQSLTAQLEEAKAETEAATLAANEQSRALADLQSELDIASSESQVDKTKISDLQRQIEEVTKARDAALAKLEKEKGDQQKLLERIHELDESVSTYIANSFEKDRQITELNQSIGTKDAQYDTLESEKERLERELEEAKEALTQAEKALREAKQALTIAEAVEIPSDESPCCRDSIIVVVSAALGAVATATFQYGLERLVNDFEVMVLS